MVLMESAEAIGSTPLFAWLMDQLRALAAIRTPFLTAIMSAITYLGQEMVFLVIGMILLWCVNKKYGYRFLGMFMFGSFLQQALKALFAIPRPWVIDPAFEPVPSAIPEATGFSFPSGHTLTAAVSLGGLAMYLKKAWAFAAATVLTLLVAFSRMYLGVHTLMDVGVGFVLGGFVLLLFWLIFLKNENRPGVLNAVLIVSVSLCIGLLVYLTINPSNVDPNGDGVKNAYVLVGAAIGMLLGKLIDDSVVHFDTKGVWWQQLIKVTVGFVLILGLRFGLKKLFGGGSETAILRGVRYFAMSFVGVGLYPMLFKVIAKDPAKNA